MTDFLSENAGSIFFVSAIALFIAAKVFGFHQGANDVGGNGFFDGDGGCD